MQEGRRRGREVRQIGADVCHGLGAEGDEVAVIVAGQLDLGHVVTTMRVCQEGLRPGRGPFDRTAQLFGGGQNQRLFTVVIDF